MGSTPERRGPSQARVRNKPSSFLTDCPSLASDCRVREPAYGGRVHPSEIPGHPGEHGPEQPEPVPEDSGGDHSGPAHLAPPGVRDPAHTSLPLSVLFSSLGLLKSSLLFCLICLPSCWSAWSFIHHLFHTTASFLP